MVTHTATAAKRGRNPRFPFVPVIVTSYPHPAAKDPATATMLSRQEQVRGLAYAERWQAIEAAQQTIDYRATRAPRVPIMPA